MARLPRAAVLVGNLLLLAPACQRDDEVATAKTARQEASRALVETLEQDASVPALLELLARSHRDLRRQLGPHRLHYVGAFELRPLEDPGRPRVGEPVLREQSVHDELTLEWGATSGEPLAFRLEQHSDADEGREVVVLDEKVYTKLRHRGWFWRALDSELHELWLDDAAHCMHDAVALAAPRLHLVVEQGEGDALTVELSLAAETDRDLVESGPGSDWRHRADIEAVEGTLVIDRDSGAWRSGEVEVGYALADRLGRKLRGSTRVEGTLEPLPTGALDIRAPAGAPALPERERYELDRVKLLDGLAAP